VDPPPLRCLCHLAVLVLVTVTFEQPKRGDGIRDDACCAARSAQPGSQLFECYGAVREFFENPELAGNEQVFSAHEARSQIKNQLRARRILRGNRTGLRDHNAPDVAALPFWTSNQPLEGELRVPICKTARGRDRGILTFCADL